MDGDRRGGAGGGGRHVHAHPAARAPPSYHLDRIEPDGDLLETVEIVTVTVPTGAYLTQAVELPDESDAHYELFAEVSRDDGTFVVYRDWLYAP